MDKTGRVLLTAVEYQSFKDTGLVPARIVNTWGITTREELQAHLWSGFAEVIDNNNTNQEENSL